MVLAWFSILQGATDQRPAIGWVNHDCRFVLNGSSRIGKACAETSGSLSRIIKTLKGLCVYTIVSLFRNKRRRVDDLCKSQEGRMTATETDLVSFQSEP